ncbi:MAG: cytochrome c-type biogenesis protein [Acidobacteriaceae bacterium]
MHKRLSCLAGVFDRSTLRLWMQLSGACLLLVFMVGAGDTAARYNQLGHQMICTCGCTQVLLECNHVGCTVSTQEEGELRNALARGDSNQLILQNFVQEYGPTVLAAPPQSGFNLVAWIAPGVVFLLAMLGAAVVIRKWRYQPIAMPAQLATDPHTNAILAKVRKETEL